MIKLTFINDMIQRQTLLTRYWPSDSMLIRNECVIEKNICIYCQIHDYIFIITLFCSQSTNIIEKNNIVKLST